jgi:Asp-tRNA(Asn)/Glu-tRNA(Gln) amidotransferase A subunit family amidase
MTFKLEETTIRDIHAAYLSGRLTCVHLVQAYLDRIFAYDQRGPALNAFVKLNPAVLEEAAALDARFSATGMLVGSLHGIPVAVKDQAETKGIETRFGSVALSGYVPEKDATIVAKMKAAGAISRSPGGSVPCRARAPRR